MLPELNSERITYIFQNMDDAVCLTGMGGELLYANPAAEALFGLRADSRSTIWASIPFVKGNDALIQLFIDGVTEKKKSVRSLVDYVNNNGDTFQLHVSLTCESEESGIILIVISDLTHLMKVHSAFARYTSPEIADYVLSDPDGGKQGGQNRDVSILMSDLRGFTALSTRLPSTDLITVLNHYFEIMSGVIQHYGGTVIEFLGDGIFVVFGAPADLPDHVSAAVHCAVDMQNAMAEVNAWNRERQYPELAMGIGISSGTVVVGNIGSDKKMKYGCMGETVNLAGRLETFCLGGEIRISENTRKRIKEDIQITGSETFMPKGGREEMQIHTIAGIGGDRLLQNTRDRIEWETLPAGRNILFHLLEGKTVDPAGYPGKLTKRSRDENYGSLVTETALKPRQDLMFQAGGQNVYAKVLEREENGYLIGFTAKPDHLAALFE